MTTTGINTRITTKTSLFVAAKALACIASLLCTPVAAAALRRRMDRQHLHEQGKLRQRQHPDQGERGPHPVRPSSVAIAGSVAQGGVRVTVGGGVKKANGSVG
ncbi:MAG: hypothetical protein R3D69_01365 [Xanthobacteraceae bacterium]